MHTEMAQKNNPNILIGQRVSCKGIAWEVLEIKSLQNIPHVAVMQVGNPTERKLISVRALFEDFDRPQKQALKGSISTVNENRSSG